MKVIFMGTPDFAVPVFQSLIKENYEIAAVVTQPDKPVGRKRIVTSSPVKQEALNHDIPVLQPSKIREEYEEILSYKPDLVVTAAYGQILPKALLDLPKLGCINVHASLLPEYRGGAPIHKALLDGKQETGVTIMYMVEKLDAGDMLSQVRIPIKDEDHVGTLHDKLSKAGAELLTVTIPKLVDKKIDPVPQKEQHVSYAPNISREMEKIDWNKAGEQIYNQIRGLHPWPVAYTTLQGQPLKIWWGDKVKLDKTAEPGSVVDLDVSGLIVATGNNIGIRITELQPAGKKRLNASQYLAGAQLSKGIKLGDGL